MCDPDIPPDGSRDIPTPLTLPLSRPITYLAEGAANVVYTVAPQPHHAAASPLYPNLLRLRKALPTATPVRGSLQSFVGRLSHHLPKEHVVDQELVKLPPGFVARANEQLRSDETAGTRPPKRRGVYLQEAEEHGLLVTDMRAGHAQGEVLVEFKPKWLAQSPTAPEGTTRCRTCALTAKRRDAGTGGAENGGFCPLDLVGEDEERLSHAVRGIVAGAKVDHGRRQAVEQRMTDWLRGEGRELLRKLKELQTGMDERGVLTLLGGEGEKQTLGLAMTLRDCTLFVKIPALTDKPIEARLADLDPKAVVDEKIDYWKGVERDLIDGGWYESRGARMSSARSICALGGS